MQGSGLQGDEGLGFGVWDGSLSRHPHSEQLPLSGRGPGELSGPESGREAQ